MTWNNVLYLAFNESDVVILLKENFINRGDFPTWFYRDLEVSVTYKSASTIRSNTLEILVGLI